MYYTRVFALYVAIICVAIFSACNKEIEAPESVPDKDLHQVVFHAGWDQETKTVLQEDGSVWWEPGDEISLFAGSGDGGGYKFTSTNTTPAPTVDFVGEIGTRTEGVPFLAIYPYDEETSGYIGGEDGEFTVFLPSVQVAVENGLPEKTFKSFAVSDNDYLYFKNLFGGIKFSVSSPDIKSVNIRSLSFLGSVGIGPALSGSFYYNTCGELLSATGSDQITVLAPDNGCFSPEKYYYAVLPAIEYDNGLVITYRKESTEASVIFNEELTISKSKFKRLYKADEGLEFHDSHSTYARFTYWNIIPNSIDRGAITEMHFHTCSDKTTENVFNYTDPYAEAVYYEIDGTVINYYTKGEVYQVTEGNGGAMFSRMINLTSIDLSCFDTSLCTDFGGMFQDCQALKEIVFGNHFNTSSAKRMSNMFDRCISLESLDLSGFDTSNVQDMNYMFTYCSSLKELDLSNFDTRNVTGMGEMFECCYCLEKLDISSFSSEILEYAPALFNQCRSMLKLDLGTFDISNLSNNNYTCYKLASRSRNCAVLCTSATKEVLLSSEANLQGCANYIQWFSPGETLPDLSMNPNPGLYCSTDYSKDRTVKMLNVASEGKGINVVIMGEAYSDRLIDDGTYEQDMTSTMEQVFSIEPLKSFRHLFNVYMVIAVSENEVVGEFTSFMYDPVISCGPDRDEIAIDDYVSMVVGRDELIDVNRNATTIIVVNRKDNFSDGLAMVNGGGGTDDEYYDYPAKLGGVAFVGKFTDPDYYRYVVCHEFGHAFAALHDEYVERIGEMPAWEVDSKKYNQSHFGWWANVSFTSDPNLVGWSRFLAPGSGYYESEVSTIEGALYSQGVWKSIEESMMNAGGEYSVPAREAIYKKIHKVAYGEEWQYSFEDFVAWDRGVLPPAQQMTSPLKVKALDLPSPKRLFKMEESVGADGRKTVTVIMN